jgi:hypothetical protein
VRKLYVITKPLYDANRELQVHLIGILSEIGKENYRFEYKNDGDFHGGLLRLPQFPYAKKVYEGRETLTFTTLYAPKPDDRYFPCAMYGAGLGEYDEWALLVFFAYSGKRGCLCLRN